MKKTLETIKDIGKIGLKSLRNGAIVFTSLYLLREGIDLPNDLESLKHTISAAEVTGGFTFLVSFGYWIKEKYFPSKEDSNFFTGRA